MSSSKLDFSSYNKVICITGAGISRFYGIPDFTSTDGLYKKNRNAKRMLSVDVYNDLKLQKQHLKWCSQIYAASDGVTKLSPTLMVLRNFAQKQKLIRIYSQNVDNFECLIGSPHRYLVQLHGTVFNQRCLCCKGVFKVGKQTLKNWEEGYTIICPSCSNQSQARNRRTGESGRIRTTRVKPFLFPDVLKYEEKSENEDLIHQKMHHDITVLPDLILVIGTSLKIPGVITFLKDLKHFTKARFIYLNLTPPATSNLHKLFDDVVLEDAHVAIPKLFPENIPDAPSLYPKDFTLNMKLTYVPDWFSKELGHEAMRVNFGNITPAARKAPFNYRAKFSGHKRNVRDGILRLKWDEQFLSKRTVYTCIFDCPCNAECLMRITGKIFSDQPSKICMNVQNWHGFVVSQNSLSSSDRIVLNELIKYGNDVESIQSKFKRIAPNSGADHNLKRMIRYGLDKKFTSYSQ